MKTLQQLAKDALSVQDASNILGVSKSYAQMLMDLREALKNEGMACGTNDISNHPINKLWANKIHDLAGMNLFTEDRLLEAIRQCETMSQPELAGKKTCDLCKEGQKKVAINRLWCPTWFHSEKGPKNLCEEHVKNFFNEDRTPKKGSWHWDEDADEAFNSLVSNIFESDERYQSAKKMVMNGTMIAKDLFVVDGQVWLVGWTNVLNLGLMDDAKEMFPVLFSNL